jgi:hypothetical protein
VLEATIEELRSIALSAEDASGFFPAMYARVTHRVDQQISERRFEDPARMAGFARTFAEWYLGPAAGRRTVPACWEAPRRVVGDADLLIVQHLLMGINAHVNHDLPQVVVESTPDGTAIDALRPDFDLINDVLAATQPDVLRDLGRLSGWTQLAAWWGGARVFSFSLDRARAQAWTTAVRLHALDERLRPGYVAELDRLVTVLAHLVASPKRPLSWLLPIARKLEEDDARVVTRQLLGPLR